MSHNLSVYGGNLWVFQILQDQSEVYRTNPKIKNGGSGSNCPAFRVPEVPDRFLGSRALWFRPSGNIQNKVREVRDPMNASSRCFVRKTQRQTDIPFNTESHISRINGLVNMIGCDKRPQMIANV